MRGGGRSEGWREGVGGGGKKCRIRGKGGNEWAMGGNEWDKGNESLSWVIGGKEWGMRENEWEVMGNG